MNDVNEVEKSAKQQLISALNYYLNERERPFSSSALVSLMVLSTPCKKLEKCSPLAANASAKSKPAPNKNSNKKTLIAIYATKYFLTKLAPRSNSQFEQYNSSFYSFVQDVNQRLMVDSLAD